MKIRKDKSVVEWKFTTKDAISIQKKISHQAPNFIV